MKEIKNCGTATLVMSTRDFRIATYYGECAYTGVFEEEAATEKDVLRMARTALFEDTQSPLAWKVGLLFGWVQEFHYTRFQFMQLRETVQAGMRQGQDVRLVMIGSNFLPVFDRDFYQGFQEGQAAFMRSSTKSTLTDQQIVCLVRLHLLEREKPAPTLICPCGCLAVLSEVEAIGFVIGWIAALCSYAVIAPVTSEEL